jgi:hypothetical protein
MEMKLNRDREAPICIPLLNSFLNAQSFWGTDEESLPFFDNFWKQGASQFELVEQTNSYFSARSIWDLNY